SAAVRCDIVRWPLGVGEAAFRFWIADFGFWIGCRGQPNPKSKIQNPEYACAPLALGQIDTPIIADRKVGQEFIVLPRDLGACAGWAPRERGDLGCGEFMDAGHRRLLAINSEDSTTFVAAARANSIATPAVRRLRPRSGCRPAHTTPARRS